MKNLLQMAMVGVLFTVTSAQALTVDTQVEGPLLATQSVLEFVRQNLQGQLANVPDVDQGGKHRLFVRVASKYVGGKNRFLYLTEIQLQRRVNDVDTQNMYWANLRSAVLWGTVPTENEVREALATLMSEKVSQWTAD